MTTVEPHHQSEPPFVAPWKPVLENEQRLVLETELASTISRDHLLQGKRAQAFARRVDCDEVAYIIDGGPQIAVVHLTYSVETDSNWPLAIVYDSVDHFAEARMIPDHKEQTPD